MAALNTDDTLMLFVYLFIFKLSLEIWPLIREHYLSAVDWKSTFFGGGVLTTGRVAGLGRTGCCRVVSSTG